jgi:hypothetical protein
MIGEGKHLMKVIDWGLTGNENQFYKINFEGEEGYVDFSVSLKSEASRSLLMKNLIMLGFEGEDLSSIELNKEKMWEVIVEHETDEKGKTWPRAKYINDPNKKRFASNDVSKSVLSKYNTELAKIRKDIEKPAKQVVKCDSIEQAQQKIDGLPF